MHRQVDWMVPADRSIIEFLYSARDTRGNPSIQTPRTINRNVGYSRQHATTRCKILVKYGLIEQTGDGAYRLTDYGERVVENEISIEELNDLEPEREEE